MIQKDGDAKDSMSQIRNIGVDISDLAQGMYTVNLIYASGQNIFKKIVVER
jgi:hypothetical protein